MRQHPPCKERLQGHARRPHKPTHACDEKSPDLLHVCGRHSLHTNRQNPPGSKWYRYAADLWGTVEYEGGKEGK